MKRIRFGSNYNYTPFQTHTAVGQVEESFGRIVVAVVDNRLQCHYCTVNGTVIGVVFIEFWSLTA